MSANQDGSFNVTSTCEHLRDKVSGNEPFSLRATVQHARLKQAVCKEWNSDNEEYQKYLLSVPVMGEITRPTLYHNKEAALLCPISGFFPINLTVTWYKKEKEGQELTPLSPSEMYKIPEISPHKQEDKKFTVTASLVFSPSLTRDNGAEFICRVAHPSLEGAIEKSSGPIHVTLACPKVNEFRIAGDWGLSLEVEEFFPRDIGISWEVVLGNKGKVTSLPCECNISANADGTYRATSACHCLRDQLDSLHTLRVSVQHEALGVPICKGLTQVSLTFLIFLIITVPFLTNRLFQPRMLYGGPEGEGLIPTHFISQVLTGAGNTEAAILVGTHERRRLERLVLSASRRLCHRP
eukprot:XP_017945867.1 PREDICTED: uncharacterized protein LOC100494628 [Xenopus tropicalis]